MTIYDFIIPVGIASIVLVLLSALLGFLTTKKPSKKKRKLHIILAIIAVDIALIHGGIVLFTQFFM